MSKKNDPWICRCGEERLPVFSAAACPGWHCPWCDVYEHGTAVHYVSGGAKGLEEWCIAFLRRKAQSNVPQTIQRYFTAV